MVILVIGAADFDLCYKGIQSQEYEGYENIEADDHDEMFLEQGCDAVAAAYDVLQVLYVFVLQVEQGCPHYLLLVQDVCPTGDCVSIRYLLLYGIRKE